MIQPISITSIASISALGSSPKIIWKNYLLDKHFLSEKEISPQGRNERESVFVGQLSKESQEKINELKKSDSKYKNLDDSVLFAIYVSREAIKNANWSNDFNFGVNFGSSRGATSLFEKYHQEFLETKKSIEVDPQDFLEPVQYKMLSTQPDLIVQFAHFLGEWARSNSIENPEVYARSFVSLQGKTIQPFIDPKVDLLKEKDTFAAKSWILPYEE